MAIDYTTILAAFGQALSVVRDGFGPLQPGQLVRLHIERVKNDPSDCQNIIKRRRLKMR